MRVGIVLRFDGLDFFDCRSVLSYRPLENQYSNDAFEELNHQKPNGSAPSGRVIYDVAVVGGGVVGCAIARRFTLQGAQVLLIEKEPDILCGASKGNSAILHTGFDAPVGSLEQLCIADGYSEYHEIKDKLGLPILETEALVVAWTEDEEAKFDDIIAQASANGVEDLRRISHRELLNREPHLNAHAKSAVQVPGEQVIDPWSAPLAYLTQAVENGADVKFHAPVTGGAFDGSLWKLETPRGLVTCRMVINCAGLYADLLDKNILGRTEFETRPRKGQFVVFDKAASDLVNAVILPVPSEVTKGVLVTRTIFGNVLVGPTAEEQDSRSDASVDQGTLENLKAKAADIIPALADMPVTAVFAGIRPATDKKHYRISKNVANNWITVGGIRSTGLSAALGIANYVYRLSQDMSPETTPLDEPIWPRAPSLAEHIERDWTKPGYATIVCHCEMVTEREIQAALDASVPPGSVSGLKRRTRATMGRCQGFYCSARLAEMLEGRFEESLSIGAVGD